MDFSDDFFESRDDVRKIPEEVQNSFYTPKNVEPQVGNRSCLASKQTDLTLTTDMNFRTNMIGCQLIN